MNFKTHLREWVSKITLEKVLIIEDININIPPNSNDESKI